MPQVQVVDTTQNQPEPTGIQEFFSKLGKSYKDKSDQVEIGKLIGDYKQNREDANAWEDLQLGLEQSTISPTKRLQTQQSLNDVKKLIIERDKSMNAKVNKGLLTEEEKVRQKGNLIKAGYPEHAAEQYLDAPPGVKGTLEREHAVLVERGLRNPLVTIPRGVDQSQPGQEPVTRGVEQSQPRQEPVMVTDGSSPEGERPVFVDDPETPQQVKDSNKAKPIPENEWPVLPKPENRTLKETVAWENNNEKENSKLLKESTDKKYLLKNKDNRINVMTKINDGKYLPDGFGRLILVDPKTGEIRPSAQLAKQINPQTSLYIKNLNQYLDGIKEQLGSVVTDFDVRTFKSQLPNLLTDEQGRRLILKQMKYTSDLESVYNNTLNQALKKYGKNANYIDISQVVEEKVKEKEGELVGKIDNLVEASDYINAMAGNPDLYRGQVLMQRPNGSFRAVPKDRVEYLKKEKQWRDF